MKLVIDIDEKTYNEIMDDAKNTPRNLSHYERIIAKGAPLPKGHGRLIDADDLLDNTCLDGIPTIIEADKGESEEISDRNLQVWEEIFKAESEDKDC